MYDTSMSEDLRQVDHALLRLRRFVEAPGPSAGASAVDHDGRSVEVSTVLVVDAIVRVAGDSSDATCSVGEVAAAVQVAHSTASRLVDRAVRAGMVERTRSVADPRRVALIPSHDGRTLHRRAVEFRTARLAGLLADWPADDVATLARLLERFADAVHPSPR